jgi:hypothetical protein
MVMVRLYSLGMLNQLIDLFVHLLLLVAVLVEINVLIFMVTYVPIVESIVCILSDLMKEMSI